MSHRTPPVLNLNQRLIIFLLAILVSSLRPETGQAQLPAVDPKYQDILRWAVTKKGLRPSATSVLPTNISSGAYDPERSGRPETPMQYFKNWYAPYDAWRDRKSVV